MIITHLTLENWRNFQHVDVDVQRRTFIVGPNASGKSNLLDAIRFLRDVANDGMQRALSRRGGISKIRSLTARQQPGITIDIQLGEPRDAEPTWRYRLAIRREPTGRHRTLVTSEQVWDQSGKLILDRPSEHDRLDHELLTQTALEQVAANREFRAIVGFLQSIEYLHLVPQMVRQGLEAPGELNRDDPFGRGFLDRIAEAPDRTRERRLKRIGSQIHQILPQFEESLRLIRDERGQPHLEARFNHWRPRSGRQLEDQLSDGTLRLIGLMWALLDGKGPLLLEEPELSLQTDVVSHLAGTFARVGRGRGRQVLVTSHSWDLVRDEGIAPEEILTVSPSDVGSLVQSGAADESAVAVAEAGGSAGDVLLGVAISSGRAQLPLRL